MFDGEEKNWRNGYFARNKRNKTNNSNNKLYIYKKTIFHKWKKGIFNKLKPKLTF